MTDRLGELLVKKNYITTEQLQKASEKQKSAGGRLGSEVNQDNRQEVGPANP
jgi:hypothetical protein